MKSINEVKNYLIENNYIDNNIIKLPRHLCYLSILGYVPPYPDIKYTVDELKTYEEIMRIAEKNHLHLIGAIKESNINHPSPVLDFYMVHCVNKFPYMEIVEQVISHGVMGFEHVLFFKDGNSTNLSLNNLLIFKSMNDAINALPGQMFRFNPYFISYDQINFVTMDNNRICSTITRPSPVSFAGSLYIKPLGIKNCICCGNQFYVYKYNQNQIYCSQFCYKLNSGVGYMPDTFILNDYENTNIDNNERIFKKSTDTITKFTIEWQNSDKNIDNMSKRNNVSKEVVVSRLHDYGISHNLIFNPQLEEIIKYNKYHNIKTDIESLSNIFRVSYATINEYLIKNNLRLNNGVLEKI